jgi:hypothetical protein
MFTIAVVVYSIMFLFGCMLFAVGSCILFDEKEPNGLALVPFLFAVLCFVTPILMLTTHVWENGYKSGQVDALNGEIYYEQKESSNNDAWEKKE